MEGFEPLARASAFAVVASDHVTGQLQPQKRQKPSLHFFSVAHAASPHEFSHYYPEDSFPFLTILGDEDLKRTMEVRDGEGKVVRRFPVNEQLFRHPTRDLVVFHLASSEDEDAFVDLAQRPDIDIAPCVLYTPQLTETGTSLRFHGHLSTTALLVNNSSDDDKEGTKGEKEAPMKPAVVEGFFLGANSGASSTEGPSMGRGFAKTDTVLETGMCGGPVEIVVAEDDSDIDSSGGDRQGVVAGMVEGIIAKSALDRNNDSSSDDKRKAAASAMLANAAVYIPSQELWDFLLRVEAHQQKQQEWQPQMR